MQIFLFCNIKVIFIFTPRFRLLQPHHINQKKMSRLYGTGQSEQWSLKSFLSKHSNNFYFDYEIVIDHVVAKILEKFP